MRASSCSRDRALAWRCSLSMEACRLRNWAGMSRACGCGAVWGQGVHWLDLRGAKWHYTRAARTHLECSDRLGVGLYLGLHAFQTLGEIGDRHALHERSPWHQNVIAK